MVLPLKPIPPWKSEKGDQDLMDKIIPNCCPRCNSKKLYKYGKDRFGNQKYQCPICKHQFAPDSQKRWILANILLALFAASLLFFITTMMIIQITVVLTRSAIILSFKLSPSWSRLRLCQTLSVSITSNVWGTAYKVPTKAIFGVPHIRVASFKDDISNNVIEAFNKQFKYWYKTRYGFNSFESANSMIMMFVFFFNFIRPHSSLSNLTPAQVAGLKYSKRQQNSLLLVSWFSLS